MAVSDCRIIELQNIGDHRGSLTFVENQRQVPFAIKRVYYLYDVPVGCRRGAHGHLKLEQFILAINGSFNITVDDGLEKKTFELHSPHVGLYVPPMIWRDLDSFSPNAVCLVLASDFYDEADYFRKYNEFCEAATYDKGIDR